jgi:hypothetical protein
LPLLGAVVILTRGDREDEPDRDPHADRRTDVGPAGVPPPVVAVVAVSGLDVALGWSWMPMRPWDDVRVRVTASLWDRTAHRFAEEVVVRQETVSDPGLLGPDTVVRGAIIHPVPEEGLHRFCIEVVATERVRRAGHPGALATRQAWACEEIHVPGDRHSRPESADV